MGGAENSTAGVDFALAAFRMRTYLGIAFQAFSPKPSMARSETSGPFLFRLTFDCTFNPPFPMFRTAYHCDKRCIRVTLSASCGGNYDFFDRSDRFGQDWLRLTLKLDPVIIELTIRGDGTGVVG